MEELKKRKLEEVDSGDISEEKLRSLLEPLAKTQLLDLLAKLGSKYTFIAEEIMNSANGDPVHRKLFVRGLAWNTTSETLRAAFEVHGEIEEGAVICDKITGICRGFGFITYKNTKSAQEALGASSKYIDGRLAVCNLACEGLSSATITPDHAQRKLYIWGLSPETTTEILLSFFRRYGEIVEGSVVYDKETNRSRCFGFVTYKTLEATNKALDDKERILGGRNITVKYADTKSRTPPNQQSQAPVLVPSSVVAPPPVVNPYPQPGLGPAQAQSGPLSSHYTYPQSVPTFPSATSYASPPIASTLAPYAPPPQFTYLPSFPPLPSNTELKYL